MHILTSGDANKNQMKWFNGNAKRLQTETAHDPKRVCFAIPAPLQLRRDIVRPHFGPSGLITAAETASVRVRGYVKRSAMIHAVVQRGRASQPNTTRRILREVCIIH